VSLALTDDHRELAASVALLLERRDALAGNRALLEAADEALPSWWDEAAKAGWMELGIAELAIVAEECGRQAAPGPLVPTAIVAAVLAEVGAAPDVLAPLTDGTLVGGVATTSSVRVTEGRASGDAVVLGGGLAQVVLVPAGDDAVLVRIGDGVAVETPSNLDPSRRAAKVRLDAAEALVIAGGAAVLRDVSRIVLGAEAVGVAARCTAESASYAKLREQFGRPIGMFQAVKHHAADMVAATELATAAVWDAARTTDPEQRGLAAAVAATLAGAAVDRCVNLNTQIHGGIAITWEHDAHLFTRRGVALEVFLDAETAAGDVAAMTRAGITRSGGVELPPEAEALRAQIRPVVERLSALAEDDRLPVLLETGYAVPHWPEPFGRAASAVEQLVIEEEFRAAGIKRPNYGITAWVLLTLVQHGTPEQIARWIAPGLRRDVVWCQLFSEPAAGSDAAGIRTKAVPTEGGWIVNGQKVWTTGAQLAGFGLLTVRTDPDVPKHQGITTVVVDMHAEGVTVRPLRQNSGDSEFNEVFFDDVFIPHEDVVGAVNAGWTVARATLGNESVSIGGDQDAMSVPVAMIVDLAGPTPRAGRYVALSQALRSMNLRSAQRAVSGGEPGPEGAITKLMLSELGHEATAIMSAAAGEDLLFLDGPGMFAGRMQLMHRAMSIAGGTSEIKRNQIAERILGLPRDPLIG
jgi:alkylation response protein AidB-like acyl-CoA dehydrogenase